jgi:hypothetical protein
MGVVCVTRKRQYAGGASKGRPGKRVQTYAGLQQAARNLRPSSITRITRLQMVSRKKTSQDKYWMGSQVSRQERVATDCAGR